MSSDTPIRRPLKSRSTAWAGFFSRAMLKAGLTPNRVSLLSLVFAAIAGAAMILAARGLMPPAPAWFIAAAGIQLRLFCNLMDGMLAVEGGLKSVTGELFNEIPDRVADALILVPLGYAAGTDVGIALGWAAAAGAVFTAYVRALGASLTRQQDFRGPMAKPHRMAAATVACLGMMLAAILGKAWALPLPLVGLIVINAGIVLTSVRRIRRLSSTLHQTNQP